MSVTARYENGAQGNIQRELLIHTRTVLEDNIRCSDVIDTVVKSDREERLLLRQRDVETLNSEHCLISSLFRNDLKALTHP